MSEEFDPTFITLTDEDGEEIVLEYVDTLEYNGNTYLAFFPTNSDEDSEDEDDGLIILKQIEVDGEEQLSTLDSDEELEAVYNAFMESLFADEEE